MYKKLAITAFISTLFTGGAYSQQIDARYYTLDESSVKIEEVDIRGGSIGNGGAGSLPANPSDPVTNPPLAPNGGGISLDDITQSINVIDNIVNLADKIWTILDKNRPVVTISTTYASAVPYGTSHWTQLQGWSTPLTKRYAFSIKNGYGSEVVKVIYQVHCTHSGNYQGKGKFLTGVTIEPLTVTAPWGYKVDLLAEVPDSTVANVGTHENPIASMQVQLKWKISTTFSSVDQKVIYYVQGDGLIQEIGTPFRNGLQEKNDRQIGELNRKLENVKF